MKTITRDLITFTKNKDEYQIVLHMQGYEHDNGNYKSLIAPFRILGVIKEDKLEEYLEFFRASSWNIEVKE